MVYTLPAQQDFLLELYSSVVEETVKLCTHCFMITDGEDGAVKIWSKTGMLRTMLAQTSTLAL